jgi:hypothetical protein
MRPDALFETSVRSNRRHAMQELFTPSSGSYRILKSTAVVWVTMQCGPQEVRRFGVSLQGGQIDEK